MEETFDKRLDYDEQIAHLKELGITFNGVSEESAKEYLKTSCYYFKLTQYKANYNKNKSGKYVGLDFLALKTLSKIDKELRYEIMNLCLDIEHNLKVKFLDHICEHSDGFEPIKEFYEENEKDALELDVKYNGVKDDLKTNYIGELIKKYYSRMPAWVFFEIVSFGTLMRFIAFYQEKYNFYLVDNRLLNNIRDLRNTVAHNNSIIRDLKSKDSNETKVLGNYVALYFDNIKSDQRNKRLQNRNIADFSSLICLHLTLIKDNKKFENLKRIIDDIPNRAECLKNNDLLVSSYDYCKKMVDKLKM